MIRICAKFIWIAVLLAACAAPPKTPAATPSPPATPTSTATAEPTYTPVPSPTPDAYWTDTIEYLRSRAYGGGQLEAYEKVGENSAFARYLFRYPSERLMIYGFMNVPKTDGPRPVIIALHGYIDPAIYQTLDYTTHYSDALASAGYLVLHPNLRGYVPSDDGENLFRVGMAIDVLNLIAIVKSAGGQPGPLQSADPARIGLWGHSMGGGIATRVLTVSPDVRAAVLYAPMSGDEARNYAAIGTWSDGARGQEERAVPQEELTRISPMYFFQDLSAAISIHHSLSDPLVPVQWSMQTCEQLKALGKDVECHYYEGMPHTFEGRGDKEFMKSVLEFFNRYLSSP